MRQTVTANATGARKRINGKWRTKAVEDENWKVVLKR